MRLRWLKVQILALRIARHGVRRLHRLLSWLSPRLVAWFLLGCLGTGLLMLVLGVILTNAKTTHAIRETQKTNTAVNTTNTQLLELIHSCLTPTGSCYKLGAAQRDQTSKGNQRAAAASAFCAVTLPHPTYQRVLACELHLLAPPRHKP